MAVVVAVNGIVESYPVKPVTPRSPLVDAVESQSGKDQRPPKGDRAVLAAQQAYEEQTRHARLPKPALLAKDLMTAPVVTLPSDATVAEAWALMTRRIFRHIPITAVHGTLVGMVSDRDLIRHLLPAGLAGTVLNAANEVAVESFLQRRMPFTAIPVMIENVMCTIEPEELKTLDDVLRTDHFAREKAHEWLATAQ